MAPKMGRTAAWFDAVASTTSPAEALEQFEAEIAARRLTAREWERQGAGGIAHAMRQSSETLAAALPAFVARWADAQPQGPSLQAQAPIAAAAQARIAQARLL